MESPNRWLRLRHPEGFSDQQFLLFSAQCRIWQGFVTAVLTEWAVVQPKHRTTPDYVFFEPERSRDGLRVTLPVGGDYTVGSRALFENASSHLLSDFFPLSFKLLLEEGLTETFDSETTTNWRRVLKFKPAAPSSHSDQ